MNLPPSTPIQIEHSVVSRHAPALDPPCHLLDRPLLETVHVPQHAGEFPSLLLFEEVDGAPGLDQRPPVHCDINGQLGEIDGDTCKSFFSKYSNVRHKFALHKQGTPYSP